MKKKKFSIGLSLVFCNKEDYISLIDEYSDNLNYIYYSPNIASMFSRGGFNKEIEEIKNEDQYEVLEYARTKGIKTELAINTDKNIDYEKIKKILIDEKEKHVPDSIVTYNQYVDVCSNIFPNATLTLSYNQGIKNYDDVMKINKKFDTVIIGNRFIRDRKMFEFLKERGFNVELLVNNGCSHNCLYCFPEEGDSGCEFFFNMNIANHNINEIVAINSVFPSEIYNNYEKWNIISNYKLSTRPCIYDQIKFLLDIFVNNLDVPYNMAGFQFQALLSMQLYMKFTNFINIEKVNEIKKKEWEFLNEKYNNNN